MFDKKGYLMMKIGVVIGAAIFMEDSIAESNSNMASRCLESKEAIDLIELINFSTANCGGELFQSFSFISQEKLQGKCKLKMVAKKNV